MYWHLLYNTSTIIHSYNSSTGGCTVAFLNTVYTQRVYCVQIHPEPIPCIRGGLEVDVNDPALYTYG